ncbi:hypothetical protein CMQ_4170 [Grosmannia clavigera kw1407]|uniref:AAA protein C-terminal winged helix domain-containing protein n=1 Tax=Grosmannia clavigera (strain kw1407 / UAMH 11150) TaxID=655863 RepID=F0X8Z1_GROCL|nr:uncharacterized protein CMQ_4170 [Grosmannia clavigera kw1407]EFX06101.1 hypothetical protein CMQ_4170 [Grosmannia clavigera kw1407]
MVATTTCRACPTGTLSACYLRTALSASATAATATTATTATVQRPIWLPARRWATARTSSSALQAGPRTAKAPRSSRRAYHSTAAGDGEGDSLGKKMLESAATSMASIVMLGLGFALAGYGYHKFYKHLVLHKMEKAFDPGDPVLELAAMGRGMQRYPGRASAASEPDGHSEQYWTLRPEQQAVDAIVSGQDVGHYHLFLGEKGTGKNLPDPAGQGAQTFDFNEDYIGGYFSERGPRESTALLDIERALNKLEKVALRRRQKQKQATHRPLILIINQMHLVRDDEDGRDLIELLQQRAEQWAASGLVTMVFCSDDYWVHERLRQLAARLEVHSIQDLSRAQATATLQRFRQRYFGETLSDTKASAVYDRVGGRLTFLNRVARSRDMMATCDQITKMEKKWFLAQCWILGADMDDDVMDQQKWAAAAMVLAQALVDKEAAVGLAAGNGDEEQERTDVAEASSVASTANTVCTARPPMRPSFALHEAQQIMTRADFVREMDRRNLFTITSQGHVRAASVPMQAALRQICGMPGFREHLDATVQRISDIESLGRTRELVAKDLVLGGRYELAASKADKKRTEVVFTGWSPHQRPPDDSLSPTEDP